MGWCQLAYVRYAKDVFREICLTIELGETMIPEGLEWASAAEILDDIKSVGWNYIRMYVHQAV